MRFQGYPLRSVCPFRQFFCATFSPFPHGLNFADTIATQGEKWSVSKHALWNAKGREEYEGNKQRLDKTSVRVLCGIRYVGLRDERRELRIPQIEMSGKPGDKARHLSNLKLRCMIREERSGSSMEYGG